MPAKVISATFALGAFAIAIIAGLSAGNSATVILINAIITLVVCNVIGLVIGAVMEHTVREHMASYRSMHPMPEVEGASAIVEESVEEGVDNSATG